MLPVLLASIKASDGVALEGFVVRPRTRSKTALIWVHGLGSRFSSGQTLAREVSSRAARAGIAYFKFNTRGHDIVARGAARYAGAAFEKFEDCVRDIRAVIRCARRLGYTSVILAGHSTGANKILYYAAQTHDRAVKGIALLGPMSDIAGEQKRIGKKRWLRGIAVARRLKARPDALMPKEFGFWGARRWWSVYHPGEREDTFPYYDPSARWTALRRIRIPVAIIVGSRDEYLDRPAKALVEHFKKNAPNAVSFTGAVVRGANHGFRKKENELARELISWARARFRG